MPTPTLISNAGGVDPAITMTPAELQAMTDAQNAEYAKNRVRGSINTHAGDPLSLLGTASDVVQLLLVAHCELIEAVRTATTVAQLKSAMLASPLANESTGLLADIKAGKTVMPYTLKTVPSVIADTKARALAIHDAIKAGAKSAL